MYRGVRAVAVQHHLRHRLPCVYRGGLASQPARAASCRGRARPRGADPCLLELPQATYWSVPCRFGAEKCVRRSNSTTSGIGAYTPIRAACGSRRRVGWALFRLLRGLSMAAPQQARVAATPHGSADQPRAAGHASTMHISLLYSAMRKSERSRAS